MKTIHATLAIDKEGYGVLFDEVNNVWAWGETAEKAKEEAQAALKFHVSCLKKDNDTIPEILQGQWQIEYRFDVKAMLEYFDGILTKAALKRITGVNASLLSQYKMGAKKPRPAQILKIQTGLHRLGNDLLQVRL